MLGKHSFRGCLRGCFWKRLASEPADWGATDTTQATEDPGRKRWRRSGEAPLSPPELEHPLSRLWTSELQVPRPLDSMEFCFQLGRFSRNVGLPGLRSCVGQSPLVSVPVCVCPLFVLFLWRTRKARTSRCSLSVPWRPACSCPVTGRGGRQAPALVQRRCESHDLEGTSRAFCPNLTSESQGRRTSVWCPAHGPHPESPLLKHRHCHLTIKKVVPPGLTASEAGPDPELAMFPTPRSS